MKTISRSQSWTRAEIRDTADTLETIGSPLRLAVFTAASEPHDSVESLRVATGERLGTTVSQGTVSRTLAWLAAAGLVHGGRRGKSVVYSPTVKGKRMLAMLARLRAEGGQ